MKFAMFAMMVLAAPVGSARADEAAANKAQGDMLMRVLRFSEDYGVKNAIPKDIQSYCRTDLSLRTARAPDGTVPYGIDLRRATPDIVKMATSLREDYEKVSLQKCMRETTDTLGRK